MLNKGWDYLPTGDRVDTHQRAQALNPLSEQSHENAIEAAVEEQDFARRNRPQIELMKNEPRAEEALSQVLEELGLADLKVLLGTKLAMGSPALYYNYYLREVDAEGGPLNKSLIAAQVGLFPEGSPAASSVELTIRDNEDPKDTLSMEYQITSDGIELLKIDAYSGGTRIFTSVGVDGRVNFISISSISSSSRAIDIDLNSRYTTPERKVFAQEMFDVILERMGMRPGDVDINVGGVDIKKSFSESARAKDDDTNGIKFVLNHAVPA